MFILFIYFHIHFSLILIYTLIFVYYFVVNNDMILNILFVNIIHIYITPLSLLKCSIHLFLYLVNLVTFF